jgi:hypothetical protein
MHARLFLVIILGAFLTTSPATEKNLIQTETLIKPLEPFKPYIGKTWRGAFQDSTPEKPMVDVSRWERALNGQAVRILHSVNDGAYGGETLIIWDKEKESLVFYYFTTAGFFTKGKIWFEDGKMISHEKVSGNSQGITEVRATGELLGDRRMRSKAEFFKNGRGVPGHEIIYVEDKNATVIFK